MKCLFTKYLLISWSVIVLSSSNLFAQVINNNGAVISISSSTVINADSIINSSAATLQNNGTTNIINLNNAGTVQGNGVYNISNFFNNTGTFTCGTSTVNYNGTIAQIITALNYYNLTVSNARSSSNITFSNSGIIGIADNLNLNATFTSGSNIITGTTFDFNGSGAQSIPVLNYEHIIFSGGNTKNLTGSLLINKSMAIGDNTTLALGNYNITLPSNATSTARVATSSNTASVTYGTGRVIVERYVPGRRKYRLITSSVSTHTNSVLTTGQEAFSIWGNWQNSGNNSTPNIGTFITGGNSADGYDQQTQNPSLFTYDDVNRLYKPFSSANSKNTKYTSLNAGIPYFMFVFGDRLNAIGANNPNNTTLKSIGTILIGDQVYDTSSTIPLSNVVGRFTMLGNPFASPINWATITKSNIENTFWGWDPNLSSTGGYITVNTSGSTTLIAPYSGTVKLNQFIQSGQGFFIKTTAASPSLIIREQDKIDSFNAFAFKNNPPNNLPLIAINLLYQNSTETVLADGTLVAFNKDFSNEIDVEDATKNLNRNDNIGIINGITNLSIDARKFPNDNDTLKLSITKLNKTAYTLQIFTNKLDTTGVLIYLFDAYLNTTVPLSIYDTNNIVFSVDPATLLSFSESRFRIVFKKTNHSVNNILNFQAKQIEKNVELKWMLNADDNILKYEIEKSESNSFSKINETASKQSNVIVNYSLLDKEVTSGVKFYRIKIIYKDGNISYSKIIQIDIKSTLSFVQIVPNPIQNHLLKYSLNEIELGNYELLIINSIGKLVTKKSIQHQGGTMFNQLQLDKKLPVGIYYLRFVNEKNSYNNSFIIQN